MVRFGNEATYGVCGGISNFIADLRDSARASNGFVLEIGCGTGDGSTIAFHEGLCEREENAVQLVSGMACRSSKFPYPLHISVDNDPASFACFKPSSPWWTFVLGSSHDPETLTAVRAIAGAWSPGIIYIDTVHTPEFIAPELELWGQISGDETVWLFHDTWIWGAPNAMRDPIIAYAAKNGWVYEDWRTEAHGLGRMRRA